MRIAVLVKQVPLLGELSLGTNGRLQRAGVEAEMNAYCRRAVAKGVELARDSGGSCAVFTLGPPGAEDVLREAVAWGADRGVLITDPAFAGSDTLATARALSVALRAEGPFDLILTGRNSVDADTGQVGPQVAEFLGLPFAGGVRKLRIDGRSVEATCEYDDGQADVRTRLPAVLSCAERLCAPAKMPAEPRRLVPASCLTRLGSRELGPGPWGEPGSRTAVGETVVHEISRAGLTLEGPVEQQAARAVRLLLDAGAIGPGTVPAGPGFRVPPRRALAGPPVTVIAEPGRVSVTAELLGAAASLATGIGGHVVAVFPGVPDLAALGDAGADRVVSIPEAHLAEDVARAVAGWVDEHPWAVLVPGTLWGREVAARLAVRLNAGLTGDAIGLEVREGRLLALKPAFGGCLVASITATSDTHLVTVRPGALPVRQGRGAGPIGHTVLAVEPDRRVQVIRTERNDDVDRMASATTVVGVGLGVLPDEYPELDPLLKVLGAELGATRKVTDNAWLPHARQIGITGWSVSPRLYVAIGLSGSFNHMIGVRAAKFVLAVNSDLSAPCFDACDVGIVGDWHEVVPALAAAIGETLHRTAGPPAVTSSRQ